MPEKALLCVLIFSVLGLSGCAQWPSPEHQAVTLESIQKLIDERQPHSKVELDELAYACTEYTQAQLDVQGQQLAELTKQMQMMSNANPSFSNSMCPPVKSAAEYEGKMVVGSVEWVYLLEPREHYKARVDSGATTSSIHAKNVTRFERNGKKWVSFELQDDDKSVSHKLEAPLVRTVSIRQASSDESEHRPVVKLTIVLGSMQHESEFTLNDREKMDYSVLLGRTFLQDIALIDVGRTMIQPKFEPVERTEAEKPKLPSKEVTEQEPATKVEAQAEQKVEKKTDARAEVKTETKADAAVPAAKTTPKSESELKPEPAAEPASDITQ